MAIRSSILTSILFGLSLAGQVDAAQPLVVYTDQSKIIDLAQTPSIVVVGNPSIADVTIQGNKVFLHGRGFGTTNVMILDEQGTQLADFEIDVQLGGNNNVSLFKAGGLQTYVCAGDCEVAMHVGDAPSYFKDTVLERNKDKIELATGQKSSEANQPPPAQ
jgi:hypothetical protein